jgi:DNA invertase Pin-like site-specific DNA recombinase
MCRGVKSGELLPGEHGIQAKSEKSLCVIVCGGVDEWIEVKASTRKSAEKRKLDELKETLKKGDTLIVAELSRLGRSVGQIAILVDSLINSGIRVITIK